MAALCPCDPGDRRQPSPSPTKEGVYGLDPPARSILTATRLCYATSPGAGLGPPPVWAHPRCAAGAAPGAGPARFVPMVPHHGPARAIGRNLADHRFPRPGAGVALRRL